MKVRLKLSNDHDAQIIKNLWPLYQHDVSEFDSGKPNRHGLFGVDDDVTTLAQHSDSMNAWWTDPAALFPYLIHADGDPAGFCLVATPPRFPSAIPADFIVHEFFVLHAHRGKGVGEDAVRQAFDLHRGRWEVVTYPTHPRSIVFWRRVIDRYCKADYFEGEMDHPWGRKVVFRFDNTEKPSTLHIKAR